MWSRGLPGPVRVVRRAHLSALLRVSRSRARLCRQRCSSGTLLRIEPADLLSRTEFFGSLPDDTLGYVARRVVPRQYERGKYVFLQGQAGDTLYVVAEGLVKVFVVSEEGEEMVLTTLRPPDSFGELSLVDGGPRSAGAQAAEETTLLHVSREVMLELLHEHPVLCEQLLTHLGGMVRRLTGQAADLVFLDLHGRVAKLLVRLAEERGVREDGAVILDLQLTQSDLAAMVGGSRQSVNQILRSFDHDGHLDLEPRRVVIRHLEALRDRGGS